jgi:sugar phosphate isomerase/epimerase
MKTCVALSPTKANFAPLLYSGNLHLGLQKAAEFGFDGVELNLRDSDALDQDAIIGWARELNLTIPSFGTGQSYFTDGMSLADTDAEIQRGVRQRMEGHIRFAARVGARVVLGSIRGTFSDPDPAAHRAEYEVALEATRHLAAYAAERGVQLTIEPINRYETSFLNTVEESLAFVDDVGMSNINVLIDTFHMNLEEASMTEPIYAAGDRLRHVHLVDSNRQAPGMGHIDFISIIAALKEIGYSGYLSGEMLPLPDDDVACRTFQRYMGDLLA